MITKDLGNGVLVDYYDSLYETIKDAREGSKTSGSRALEQPDQLNKACDLALYGWPEGLEKLNKSLLKITAKLPTFSSPRVNRFSMTTGSLIPERYHMGHPEMLRRRVKAITTPIKGHGKVIRFVYNYAISPDIGASDRFDIAAAIVTCIKSLEANGYECELIMVNGNRGNNSYGTNAVRAYHHVVTVAKCAGQPLSLESVAYLLCSTNMDRQIAFSLFDRWDSAEHKRMSYSNGAYFPAVSYFPPEYEQAIKIGAYSTQDDIPIEHGNPVTWIKNVLSAYGISIEEQEVN